MCNVSDPPPSAVVLDYADVLVDWRPERVVGLFYPPGVTAMFFDAADPHGYDHYRRRAAEGWDDERILEAYTAEHGPAVGWIMHLLLEHRALGLYDMPDGMPSLLRELAHSGIDMHGFANCSRRAVALMHAKYPWLDLLGLYDMPDGMPSLLRELAHSGIDMHGFANCSRRAVALMHAKYPWLDLLGDAIGYAPLDGVEWPRALVPSADALARHGLDPATTLYVTHDDDAARTAARQGLHAIRFDTADGLRTVASGWPFAVSAASAPAPLRCTW